MSLSHAAINASFSSLFSRGGGGNPALIIDCLPYRDARDILAADEGYKSEPHDFRDVWLADEALLLLLFLRAPLGSCGAPEDNTDPVPPAHSPESSSRVDPAALEPGVRSFLLMTLSTEIEGSWMYVAICGLL